MSKGHASVGGRIARGKGPSPLAWATAQEWPSAKSQGYGVIQIVYRMNKSRKPALFCASGVKIRLCMNVPQLAGLFVSAYGRCNTMGIQGRWRIMLL
ncbi:hypothetical protein CAP48_09540 [Advenella sp. S44]|nr:hypothetical protein CAP48_09540 [Advenella sp. S44]